MRRISVTKLRRNLKAMLDVVNDDHEPLIVNRTMGKSVVVLSLEDYEALRRRPLPRPAISDSMDQVIRSMSEVDELRFVAGSPAPQPAL